MEKRTQKIIFVVLLTILLVMIGFWAYNGFNTNEKNISTEIVALVGQDILKSGDRVKEGEVIRYKFTIKNDSIKSLKNVQVKLDVPEGTTYVRPIPEITREDGTIEQYGYVYADGYYEEIKDVEKLAELTTITIPELSKNNDYKIEYEVRVNKGAENNEISNISKVMYKDKEIKCAEIKNKIQESNIRVTIKRTVDESVQLKAGGIMKYKVYIENLTDSIINNLQMQIISDTFDVSSVSNKSLSLKNEDLTDKIAINEIQANSKIYFSIVGKIKKDIREINTSIIVNDSTGNTYKSNLLKEKLMIIDTETKITSPQNGQYIKEGDIVEYNISVKNVGEAKGVIGIIEEIPSILQVQSIYINGKLDKQNIDSKDKGTYTQVIGNNITETETLDINENTQLKIISKVGKIQEAYNGKVITNSVKVRATEVLEGTSEMITHILKANDNNVQNVISGFAWYDEDENGKRDANEKILNGINVKIYDINSQSYLKDEKGHYVSTQTDSNGEYSFSNIKNGSYLVTFEYDAGKYALTIPNVQNVDSSINSKATIKSISNEQYIITLPAIELKDLKGNTFGLNLGLKENTGEENYNELKDSNNQSKNNLWKIILFVIIIVLICIVIKVKRTKGKGGRN